MTTTGRTRPCRVLLPPALTTWLVVADPDRPPTRGMGGGIVVGPPKSRGGLRTFAVPTAIRAEIVGHLAEFVDAGPDALVFTGVQGRALHRGAWGQRVKWMEVVTKLGLAGLHFHDLRHAGNIWAPKAGMSTRDLMARMGHDDMRAALIYQRATSDADRLIADRLSLLIDEHRRRHPDPAGRRQSGTGRGRLGGLVVVLLLRTQVDLGTTKAQLRCGHRVSWAFVVGADDGNRTRVFSLGS
jgi:hypothetical protein